MVIQKVADVIQEGEIRMFLKCTQTGSTGNNYWIEYNNQILLLDAGVKIADIKKSIDYRVGDVVGCLVTHSHL